MNKTLKEYNIAKNVSEKTITLIPKKCFKKGSFIFFHDDEPHAIYILDFGQVSIIISDENGNETILQTLKDPGEIFGEVFYALKLKYNVSARVDKDSEIYLLDLEQLDLESSSQFKSNLMMILAHKTMILNSKIQILTQSTLEQKIIMLLKINNGEIEMSREAMADYLAVQRPSLSRTLMKMHEDGQIKINKRKISLN